VVRAGVQNPDMVGALGISLQPTWPRSLPWRCLAGLAGVMLAPIFLRSIRRWAPKSSPRLRRGGDRRAWFVLGVVVCGADRRVAKGLVTAAGIRVLGSGDLSADASGLLVRPRGLFGERILRFE